jgi:hypothetical protein
VEADKVVFIFFGGAGKDKNEDGVVCVAEAADDDELEEEAVAR